MLCLIPLLPSFPNTTQDQLELIVNRWSWREKVESGTPDPQGMARPQLLAKFVDLLRDSQGLGGDSPHSNGRPAEDRVVLWCLRHWEKGIRTRGSETTSIPDL